MQNLQSFDPCCAPPRGLCASTSLSLDELIEAQILALEGVGNVYIRQIGGVGDGVHDNTDIINTAIEYLETIGGGVIYFDAGKYLFNITITSDNIRIVGQSYGQNGLVGHVAKIFLGPFDPTLPVIKVGDDTKLVVGFRLENTVMHAGLSSPYGDTGLYFSGGSYDAHVRNVSFMYFKYGIRVQGGVTWPASKIFVDGFSIVNNDTDSNQRGVQVAWPSAGYTTAVYFANGVINGPTVTGGYAIEQDGTVVGWNNVYLDCSTGKGVLLKRSGSTSFYPVLKCANVDLDAGGASNVVVTLDASLGIFAVVANWAQWVIGTCKPTGRLLTTTPSLVEGYPNGMIPPDSDALRMAVGLELSFYDYAIRSTVPGTYNYDSSMRLFATANDLNVSNSVGNVVTTAVNVKIVGPTQINGVTQVTGHALASTSSTIANTGEVTIISHTGTKGILETSSFGATLTPLGLRASGIEGLVVGITGRIQLPIVPTFANNAAALLGGLVFGEVYQNGADPNLLCRVT